MYDTEKRVELVKKRMYEYRRRKERHRVYHLSALCALLFLSLAGALGTVQIQPMDAAGMYGAILLHEGVGGYVLVAMTAFVLAVVITVVCNEGCMKREKKHKNQKKEQKENTICKKFLSMLLILCLLFRRTTRTSAGLCC